MNRFIAVFSLLAVMAICSIQAQDPITNTPPVISAPAATPPPAPVPEPAATTNAPSTTATNLPPAKPQGTLRPSSTSVFSTSGGNLGGKFTLSGRTLTLPAPEATPHPADAWRRTLDFGMNMTRGNSETLRYELGLDAAREWEKDFFRIRAKGAYGESGNTKDTENANAGTRYEHMLTEKVYALGNLYWMNDSIAGLRYRVTGVASPGFRLIRTDSTLLNLEAGAGYISEKKTGTPEQNYMAGRAAITVERVLNAHVLTWFTSEYLPKLSDTSVFLLDTEAGISAVLTRDLSLNFCYQVRYDSEPVEGKKSTNSTLTTALSLNF